MKKIRLKFFAITALSLFVVLFSIILGLSLSNNARIVQSAKDEVSLIMNNPVEPIPTSISIIVNNTNPEPIPTDKSHSFYFISYYANDNLAYLDSSHTISLDVAEATVASNEVYSSGSSDGYKGSYYYQRFNKETYVEIVFVDQTQEINFFNETVKNSIIIASIGYVVVLVLIYFLSSLVVKPAIDANKKQKQFITDASHELKTPLTVINSNVSLIEMENGESEWTKSIHKQVSHLTELTNELVLLAKLNEDKIILNKSEIELESFLSEITDSYLPLLKNKDIDLSVSIEPNLVIKADPIYISRVFYTLMDNMYKYASKGEAKVCAKKIRNNVEITFINKCNPNSNLDVKEMFERFYKADKSRNSKNRNSFGIGLSMSKAIVELHKGKISASYNNETVFIRIIF